MQSSTRRLIFYMGIFILCFVMALVSVVMSVRTVAINDRIIKVEAEVAKLKIENDYIEYKLLCRLRFEELERVARTKLNMEKVESYQELD